MFNPVKPALIGLLLTTAPLALTAQTATDPATTDTPATDAPATDAPATDAPATEAPAADAPATDAPAGDAASSDTPVPDAAAPEAPAADAPAATDGAATAASGPQVGQPYVRETFGDWSLRCLKAEAGELDPCQLYQLLEDADGNAVAEFSTFPLPAGGQAAAGATIVVPLETLLTAQLRLTVDNGEPKVYPYTFCNAAGCVARVGFTEAEVNQLKRGAAAKLRMVPAAAPDQEVVLDMSLSGFTAGFQSVDEQ